MGIKAVHQCQDHIRKKMALTLFVCLVAVCMSFPAVGQFLEEPQSYNAYQGQLDVMFNCVVDTNTSASYGTWLVRVNDSEECTIVHCGTWSSNCPTGTCCPYTLMNATVENNDTWLQCLATTNHSCNASDVVQNSTTVRLLIQGLLAAPSNVTAATTATGVTTIMWEPPFTLDITDVDPDITAYTIYQWTSCGLVVIADDVPGNATNFTFPEDRPCVNGSKYLVRAFNLVGEGNLSEEIRACKGSTILPVSPIVTTSAPTVQPSDSNAAAIAGSIVPSVVVLVVIAIVCYIAIMYRRRKRTKAKEIIPIAQGVAASSTSDVYNRMSKDHRVMPDSADPIEDLAQTHSSDSSLEPPENSETKPDVSEAAGQQHEVSQQQSQFASNSQYSLLQPAEDVQVQTNSTATSEGIGERPEPADPATPVPPQEGRVDTAFD